MLQFFQITQYHQIQSKQTHLAGSTVIAKPLKYVFQDCACLKLTHQKVRPIINFHYLLMLMSLFGGFVVTSTQNHRINNLLNIIEIFK